MSKKLASLVFAALICLGLFSPLPAFASHLRGTTISWSPTAVAGEVQFTVQYSQRASASGCSSSACLGRIVGVGLNFGDGSNATVSATITSINTAEDYFTASGTAIHTYAGAGPYTAFYQNCCRVSTLKNGHDQTIRMETLVSPRAVPTNHSPVVSEPAIITVPLQATSGFFVSASDADHNTLTYRLSTASEMYATANFGCSNNQPPGLTVGSDGHVNWDTTQITQTCGYAAPQSGDLWAAQFMVQDVDSNGVVLSKVPLDIILKFNSSTEAPPTISFDNPGPFSVQAGTNVTFVATGNDTTANSRVTLNATGLPQGATASNTNQALTPPASSTFSWTPTSAQSGSYVITYSATNDTFQQVLASVSIFVQNVQPPVLTCPATLTTQYNAPLSIPVTVSDPQADALAVVWSVDGISVRTDNVPASSGTNALSLTQTFLGMGLSTVSIKATDTHNLTAVCLTSVNVVPADQTISFAPLAANVTNGDPDLSLNASSSSGLPVSFTSVGGCSVLNSALHILAAGSCSISASQAGNSNFNAAPTVLQQLTVARGSQAISFTLAGPVTYGVAPITLNASGGATGNSVTFTVISGPGTITGNTLNIAGAGAVVVAADQLGNSNYNPAPTVTQTLIVNQATLSVTAANATRLYGGVDPVFTGTIAGIVNSDTIVASYTSNEGASSAVGTYAIVPSLSGVKLANYLVTLNNAVLDVTPAPLVVTAASVNRPYGSPNPAFGGTITGLVNNDPITPAYSSTATSGSNTGAYSITFVLADPAGKLGNYNVTANSGILTIVKANQTIQWPTPAALTYATPLSSAQLNAIVSVPGPEAAGVVTYAPASGTVFDAGVQTLTVNVAGSSNYNPATAAVLLTVNQAQPVFSELSAPTITYHTGSATLSGTVTAPTAIPAGQQVSITLNNVTQSAVIGVNGSFSTTFNTAALPVAYSGYTVGYAYAGSKNFFSASASSKLTVAYAVCYGYDSTKAKNSGSTYPIKVTVCDVAGQNVATAQTVLTGIGWGSVAPTYTPLPMAGNSNRDGSFRNTGAGYMWNLQTTGMSSGNYNVYFSITGDPTLHYAPFAIR